MDIARVVQELALIELGNDKFRGWAPKPHSLSTRAFGGHVLAQALRAATLTLPAGRLPQSLHAYFIRPVSVEADINFTVSRHLDGGAFSMRRVVARQQDEIVLELQASAGPAWEEAGPRRSMEGVPKPESLPPVQQQLAPYASEQDGWWTRRRPFELRYATIPPREALDSGHAPSPESLAWFRWFGTVEPDPLLARCLLVYLTDTSILDPVVLSRWGRVHPGSQHLTSLDHSVWFHAEPDLTEWMLYGKDSPGGTSRTGLSVGQFYRADGTPVCTVAQEGLIRSTAIRPDGPVRETADRC